VPNETTSPRPAKRRRRAAPAVLALVLLALGAGLLWFSLGVREQNSGASASEPIRTTTRSPVAVAASPRPTLPGDTTETPGPVITTYVVVTTEIAAPPAQPQDSGTLALITTVSGLLASLAGIVSAVVSIRGTRAR